MTQPQITQSLMTPAPDAGMLVSDAPLGNRPGSAQSQPCDFRAGLDRDGGRRDDAVHQGLAGRRAQRTAGGFSRKPRCAVRHVGLARCRSSKQLI
jgi:hypothetical protein